jgi:hypothetical protein
MRVKKDLEGIRDDLMRCIARLNKYKKLRTLSNKHLHVSAVCDHLTEGVEVLDELVDSLKG